MVALSSAASAALIETSATQRKLTSSIAKLSAGSRILSARDDAAALALAQRAGAEAASLAQAGSNASQAQSILQISEGAFDTIGDILVRAKTLAVQAGNSQLSDQQRAAINTEFSQLRSEIDRISGDTTLAGQPLSSATSLSVRVGTGVGASDNVNLSFPAVSASALNLDTASLGSVSQANAALSAIDDAIGTVNTGRALLGAGQSRLETAGDNISQAQINTQAVRSTLADLDVAATATALSSEQIQLKAGISALSKEQEQRRSFIDILV